MAVIRTEKTKNFTIIDKAYLQDKRISIKAKGLLSVMLALPETWKYSVRGLAAILKEGPCAVRSAINEMEKFGYIERVRKFKENGLCDTVEYIITERPEDAPMESAPTEVFHTENPVFENRSPENLPDENQPVDYRTHENPPPENRTQLSNKEFRTKELSMYVNQSSIKSRADAREDGMEDGRDRARSFKNREKTVKQNPQAQTYSAKLAKFEEIVREKIDYECICMDMPERKTILDELVGLMAETAASGRSFIRVQSEDLPAETVKKRILSLDIMHIKYVLESFFENRSRISNIKAYMLSVLYNASSTINCYYRSKFNVNFA